VTRRPAVILLASLVLAGAARPAASQTPSAAARPSHPFRGTVQKIDPGAQTVLVSNENVSHWMPPMTMSYRVSNPAILRTLKAGDRVSATVYDGDFTKLYRVRVVTVPPGPVPSLPPVSYVCQTPGEEGVIDDRPGTCPKSGRALVPIRLAIAYSCLRGPRFIQGQPGVCAYDKSPLAPVTASMFWVCGDSGKRYLAPGPCADGAARVERFEIRPHGDHNPRHGGLSVFMSDDLLHHVEGTFVTPGVFRVYFYDEYTRPLRVRGLSARVAQADNNATQTGAPVVLVRSQTGDGNAMEARIPGAPTPTTALPLDFKLHVNVAPGSKDWVTDYHFQGYSKEPPPVPPGTTTASTASATVVDAVIASLPFTMKQAALPSDTRALLALLKERSASFDSLLQEGNLTAVWFPAIGSKDVGLELEQRHLAELPRGRAPQLASAVQRLTLAAWQIDAAGDLGNKERLLELARDFTQAIADIEGLYAPTR
jgi:Cu/Ag efflux protein CusF